MSGNGAGSDEGGSCRENTHEQEPSQIYADPDEAFEILHLRSREYREYECSEWGEGYNWRLDAASHPQVKWLLQFGVDARKRELDRGNTSRLLAILIRRQRKGLCAFSTARWLYHRGLKNAARLSVAQAAAAIRQIEGREVQP